MDERKLQFTKSPLALWKPALSSLAIDEEFEGRTAYKVEIEARTVKGKTTSPGSVAVIPIDGILDRRNDWWGTATENVSNILADLKDDERIAGVVLDIDSPGGSVNGVDELAADIRAFGKVKPIGAHTGGVMASGAYWLGAQANFVSATRTAVLGSIGVYSIHEDMSEYLKKMGVDITFISAGEHKVDGNPFEPLSDDARDHMQTEVNHYYDLFVGAVAKGRELTKKQVLSDFGQGKVFNADEAKSRGMIDSIANTVDVAIHSVGARAIQAGHPRETITIDDSASPLDGEREHRISLEREHRIRLLNLTKQKLGM